MKPCRAFASVALLLLCACGTSLAACPELPPKALQSAFDATRFGAMGDGLHDDTAALQAAIDATPIGGTLYLPAGTYRVAVGQSPLAGLRLKSDMNFVMHDAAMLTAIPTKDGNSAVLKAWSVSKVRVHGGTIVGERHEHLGSSGEWGMGLDVRDASAISVVGTQVRDTWGDGFYIGGEANSDIHFCGVVADGSRRNGMSIVAAKGMTVRSSRFMNSAGTPPQAGLDIEPDGGLLTEGIVVTDSFFSGNRGAGISLGASCLNCGAVNRNHTIRGNTISRNGGNGIHVSFQGHSIERNTIEHSGGSGILLWRADASVVRDNLVRRSKVSGLQLEGSTGNRIDGNRFDANPVAMLLKSASTGNELAANQCATLAVAIQHDRSSTGNRIGPHSCR